MTDKVYVTKENLENVINTTIKKTQNTAGIFSMMFVVIWLFILAILSMALVICSLAILFCAIPFYYIEQLFQRRKNNATTE